MAKPTAQSKPANTESGAGREHVKRAGSTAKTHTIIKRSPTERQEPMPIAVLVSGEGTNLQALLDTVHGREAEIVAVVSSKSGARALERAAAAGVERAVFARGDYPDRAARDTAMAGWLAGRGAELVVLAGYMEIVGEQFLDRFPGAVINVHPSLLPAFPGMRAVEQAIEYGVKVFGVTVHFVDAGVDSGPVIAQRAVELPDARDPALVLERLHQIEHELLAWAVRKLAAGELRIDPDNPRLVVAER